MTNPPAIPLLPESWAEIRAYDLVMRYRCLGVGAPLLLLAPGSDPPPLWPELTRLLAIRFRMLVPAIPPGTSAGDWLTTFLEGLGTTEMSVVATGPLCMPALELALRDVDQIARILLVPEDDADALAADGALTSGGSSARMPLLVVGRGMPAEEAVPLVMRFLEDGDSPP